MTDKISLNDIATFDNTIINTYNVNNATLTTAVNNTLSRDGTLPNQMQANIDMNSYSLLNVSTLTLPNIATADPHVLGQVWSNAGILTVSGG